MTTRTDEMRLRLDVPVDLVPDARLDHMLIVAENDLTPFLVPDAATLYPDNVDEGVIQLAIKIWDTSTRGAVGMDAVGEFLSPAPTATLAMIRSVFGVLGPALATAGISV